MGEGGTGYFGLGGWGGVGGGWEGGGWKKGGGAANLINRLFGAKKSHPRKNGRFFGVF